MSKRIQIVARIDPTLRKEMGRAAKRDKTTLNAIIEAALASYLAGPRRSPGHAPVAPKETK